MNELIEQNQSLQDQMNNLLGDYQAMAQQMQNLETKVGTLSEENAMLKEKISDLENSVSNHSHSYFTGEGKGHNSTEVSTGPAMFPAGSEPIPKGK
jgi:predicted nuclease with TOPRIM domain